MPWGSLPYFTRESEKSLPRCQRYQVWIVVLLLRSIVQKWSSYPSLQFRKNEQGCPSSALGEPWIRTYLVPVLMFLMYIYWVSRNSSMKQLSVSGTMWVETSGLHYNSVSMVLIANYFCFCIEDNSKTMAYLSPQIIKLSSEYCKSEHMNSPSIN